MTRDPRMNRLLPPILLIVIFSLALVTTASATTYYIAANGSDSNSGTSKATPWLHAPGMAGCTGACASASPKPGDQIILRGGDTWTVSGAVASWWSVPGGSSGNDVHIGGLDATWYAGSSWTRPVLNGGGTWPGINTGVVVRLGPYNEFANIEIKGILIGNANWPGATYVFASTDGPDLIHDNYLHGWSHSAGVGDSSFGINCNGATDQGSQVYRNVIDGSDTAKDGQLAAIYGATCSAVYQNYIAWVQTGMNGIWKQVHDNVFYQTAMTPYPGSGAHNNAMESNNAPGDPPNEMVYNNVFLGMPANGGIGLNLTPINGNTSYIFNNVIGDGMAAGNTLVCGYTNAGTCQYLHNTFECGPDPNGWSPGSAPNQACTDVYSGASGNMAATFVDNHFISSTGVTLGCSNASCVITQIPNPNTSSTPGGGGYSYTQPYIFSPSSGSSVTVGASSNDSAYCSTINAIDAAAGSACMSDTTYGVSYNATTHTVSFPARTPVARPSSGNWDAGAYQYTTSGGKPNPPTGLTGVVQ